MSETRGRAAAVCHPPPPCRLYTVSRDTVKIFEVKDVVKKEDGSHESDLVNVSSWHDPLGITVVEPSPCGSLLAIGLTKGVKLFNIDSNGLLAELYLISCETTPLKLSFSSKGTFIIILTAFNATASEKNLKIWDVKKNELKASSILKGAGSQEKWPPLKWSSEETFCFRLMPTELQVFPGLLDEGFNPAATHQAEKGAIISVSPEISDGSVNVAICNPPKSGMPARVQILSTTKSADSLEVVNSRSFFRAQEVSMCWNSIGTGVIITASMEADTSGKSYYGSSSLYFLEAKINGLSTQLVSSEDGPVCDVAWSPSANEFALIYGSIPPKIKLFDGRTGDPKLSFGDSRKNTIRFNPFGRFICFGGFGNLAGDVDIWDKNKKKIIGNFKAPCTVTCDWSPDGRMLLCATTTPRLRVDNGFKIFLYNGALLCQLDIAELYSAKWLPVIANTYTDRAASCPRNSLPSSLDVYRPPGATGVHHDAKREAARRIMQSTAEIITMKSKVPPGAEYLDTQSKTSKRNAAKRKKAKEAKEAANNIS